MALRTRRDGEARLFSRSLSAGLLILLVSPAGLSWAQVGGTTATLRGSVDDASGSLVQGATITLVNTATQATRTADR
jgi:hypothetical protein